MAVSSTPGVPIHVPVGPTDLSCPDLSLQDKPHVAYTKVSSFQEVLEQFLKRVASRAASQGLWTYFFGRPGVGPLRLGI